MKPKLRYYWLDNDNEERISIDPPKPISTGWGNYTPAYKRVIILETDET